MLERAERGGEWEVEMCRLGREGTRGCLRRERENVLRRGGNGGGVADGSGCLDQSD